MYQALFNFPRKSNRGYNGQVKSEIYIFKEEFFMNTETYFVFKACQDGIVALDNALLREKLSEVDRRKLDAAMAVLKKMKKEVLMKTDEK